MKRISDLLERFAKLAGESEEVKKQVSLILKKNGIRISDFKNMKIKNGIVTLKISPILKSELALKQKKIITDLSKNILTKNITVVR